MRRKQSIECWILNSARQVLLLQVPKRPYKHESFWQPVTGGIELDESERQAAFREVQEETAIVLAEASLTEIASGIDVQISPELTIRKTLFSAYSPRDEVTISPEHQAFQWFPPNRVAGALFWESNLRTWGIVRSYHMLNANVDRR